MTESVAVKRCSKCGETKTPDCFTKANTKDGLYAYCKDCRKIIRKKIYDTNNGIDESYYRSIKQRYDLSRKDYEAMADAQGWCCGICGRDPRKDTHLDLRYRRLHVDHWHDDYNAARGLLCGNCNFGVGRWLDNPSLLKAAVHYLERHWSKKAA